MRCLRDFLAPTVHSQDRTMKGPDCHHTDAGSSDQVEHPRGWLIKVAGGSGDTILNLSA
jgi:hypothetical protein